MWSMIISSVMGLAKGKSSILIDVVLILIVTILIGGGIWKYQSMQGTIKNYKAELNTVKIINIDNQNKIKSLKVVNDYNIKKLSDIKVQYQKNIDALHKKIKTDIQRVKTITIIKDRIKYIKPKDDNKTAKVLLDTLHQISKLEKK